MMSTYDYYKIIVDLVPQWYSTKSQAPYDMEINIDGDEYWISSNRNATPDVRRWKEKCLEVSIEVLNKPTTGSTIIDRELVQSRLVKEWLVLSGYPGDWERLFDYSRSLEARTYENSTIGFTYVYNPKKSGDICLIEDSNQKILDVLGETQYTFFKIGVNWTYLDYNYVTWHEIKKKNDYKLIPEFLYPYQSILEMGECAITKTKRGDLIIYDRSGLLASCRKGEWKIYDSRALKNNIVDYIGEYRVGCNLFEILFDLSYRRHGALIVIDTNNAYKKVINNQCSLIENGSTLHRALSGRINQINLNEGDITKVSKQLILELASVDGALVLDKSGSVLAFGAIINSHKDAHGEIGARSTAALSAHLFGLKVFKVSSDGEITLYQHNNPKNNDMELIRLNFL
ncbi:diadenylate cyclase [Bacillus cereus]